MFWGLFKSAKEMNDDLDKKIKAIVKPYEDEIIFLQSMERLDVKDGEFLF